MPVIYSNNASTTLSAGINDSTTTIGIASASGFPSISGSNYYFATLANTNNTKIEVVKVTAGTTSLTVTRAQDGTTAQAFDSGDNFQVRVTAATLEAATKTDVNITGGAIAGAAITNDVIDSQHYAAASIDNEHLADNAVGTAEIADDAVTADKLANAINTAIAANTAKTSNATHTGDVTGATELTIASGAVETGMIADDAVTADKLANSINTEITANTAKVTNATHTGDVTGATALTIAADAVTTAKIADDAVTADKLANSINTDIATGVTANTTANAALPKAGGTMTGDIVMGANKIGADAGDYIAWTNNTHTSFVVNANEEMRLEADGDLHVDGDVIAFSTTISDATLKYDINPIDHALDKVAQLTGVTYKYLKDGMESAGLLAQDVEKVMPCAVSERKLPLHKNDGKSYKTLNYDNLHALLIESIKELTAKVEKLEKK